eukprot:jgi/Ulvmu1/11056/UM007_0238.1
MANCLTRLVPTIRARPGPHLRQYCKVDVLLHLAGTVCASTNAAVCLTASRIRDPITRMPPAPAVASNKNTTSPAVTKPKVIVLTGPTGVGKTELSLILAEQLNGEIISADSVQVYKRLDVGSDKLPPSQRRGIPHHLIDVLDPFDRDAEYSAGTFHDAAHAAAAEIVARGATPIVTGGTGFYLRTFMCGKPQGGKASPEVEGLVAAMVTTALEAAVADVPAAQAAAAAARDQSPAAAERRGPRQSTDSVAREAGQAGRGGPADAAVLATGMVKAAVHAVREDAGEDAAEALEERLWVAGVALLRQAGDEEGAVRVAQERNNWYRLQRSLEIVLATGRPTSASAAATAPCTATYDFRPFFLHRPRLEVFRRIDERVEHMVLGGLLDEAHMLREAGARPGDMPATRAIGYRQALEWLEGVAAARACNATAVRQLAASIQAATRRLQRAQLVFHRGDSTFAWIDATGGSAAAADAILAKVAEEAHVGGSESFGALSKAEKDAAKRYTTQWGLLDQEEHVAKVIEWLANKGYIDQTSP